MSFRSHPLIFVLIPLSLFAASVSAYRFLFAHDYPVEYEAECNPASQDCFVRCSDDACTEQHYYAKVIKPAAELKAECGDDITGCEDANTCLPTDIGCSVTYCSADTASDEESCDHITGIPSDESLDAATSTSETSSESSS